MDATKLAEAISHAESVQERLSWVLMALKSPTIDKGALQRYMHKLNNAWGALDEAVQDITEETAQ